MQRKVFPWIFTVLILIIILAGPSLSVGPVSVAIFLAFIADLYAIRISLIDMRIKLDQQGRELGHVIPSTLVIFAWLIYAVVHFQIFLSIVHYLDLPAAALKWVFPLTALKALWPVYYLGSKLPAKKQDHCSSNKIVFQIPWANAGAFVWWRGNEAAGNSGLNIVWGIVIILIVLSPGIFGIKLIQLKSDAKK